MLPVQLPPELQDNFGKASPPSGLSVYRRSDSEPFDTGCCPGAPRIKSSCGIKVLDVGEGQGLSQEPLTC